MNSRTNLAIVGYGYMGKIYKNASFELYSQSKMESYYKYDLPGMLKGFRLRAIVDPVFSSSRHDAEEDIWYLTSLKELFSRDDLEIDCAVIATPIKTHFSVALELIRHRLSLLIEKPVCETAKEVKKLMLLARKYRIKIMPGHVERYNPVTLDAAEAVTYKVYGKVQRYRFLRESPRPERVKDSLITDKLVHDLDLVHCILGKFRITGIQVKRTGNEIMECTLSTAHRNGVRGTIVSSWLSSIKRRIIVINFERGSLTGDLIGKKIDIDRYMELSKQISGYKNNQIKDQLVDFIAYSHKFIKPLVTMKDALESAYLIDEINRRVENEV